MRFLLRTLTLISLFVICATAIRAQQSSGAAPNLAIEAVGAKGRAQSPVAPPQRTEGQSVADVARNLRGEDLAKVRVSPEEAKGILKSVQPVLRFASTDSGLAIHTMVKSRMISRDDLRTMMQVRKIDDDEAKHLQAEELTLKKFGYVPRTFSTGKFVEGMFEEVLAGFYDPRTKVISLLDWVAPESQLSVLAHELTHALQDQNFNLMNWQAAAATKHSPGEFQVSEAEALQESDARRAVTEGQAMVVLIDYQWMQHGIDSRLELVPGASSSLSSYLAMVPAPDTPVIHAAPVFLRDGMGFAYREGLVFELELLGKGGRQLAFSRVFARPPINTHEILHPDAYLQREKIQAPQIPDLNAALSEKYEVIDAGGLGELDVRSLIKQFDNSRVAESISQGWHGSSYLVVKRKEVPTEKATTADVGLVYVSAWSSKVAAQRFARFYADSVSKRYAQAVPAPSTCQGNDCPLESFQFNTEEGFVSIERRPNNLVLVTESFEPNLAVAVNAAIVKANTNSRQAAKSSPELSARYLNSPVFADLRALWEERMLLEVARAFGK